MALIDVGAAICLEWSLYLSTFEVQCSAEHVFEKCSLHVQPT